MPATGPLVLLVLMTIAAAVVLWFVIQGSWRSVRDARRVIGLPLVAVGVLAGFALSVPASFVVFTLDAIVFAVLGYSLMAGLVGAFVSIAAVTGLFAVLLRVVRGRRMRAVVSLAVLASSLVAATRLDFNFSLLMTLDQEPGLWIPTFALLAWPLAWLAVFFFVRRLAARIPAEPIDEQDSAGHIAA